MANTDSDQAIKQRQSAGQTPSGPGSVAGYCINTTYTLPPAPKNRAKKVIIVMPAYNAEKTLERTFHDIPRGCSDEVIVVDDASADDTVAVAAKLSLRVLRHPKNLGYGANQKTCYDEALKRGADIVVMLHPDHQYDPTMIPHLLAPLLNEEADAVFGSRMLGGKFFEGGMPRWKFYGNIILTAIGNLMLGIFLTEFHSGFRAYSRRYLETVHYKANSNHFVFDTQMIVQAVQHHLKVWEIPIETRYFDDASQINVFNSCRYALEILWTLCRYQLNRLGVLKAEFLNVSPNRT
ncbi:MAG: glycosyltransferase family 2 protein [Vampirovibrionales bacterium]|nr:glycosyltransferase family 2 protein [Vampirovibrionales bacterium]